MSNWEDKFWPANTKVKVLECLENGETQFLGEGELVEDVVPTPTLIDVDLIFEHSPKIRMPNGRIIRGYDCFWIPVEIAEGNFA